ncbi:uncharacterized protein LOC124295050 [Neodiprion lecontei]|uniref:Uncharacterized protein LOC124295050 n=1 Tax=Neodiprion lecontei TaxID=441921 RepID=A0ABM3GFT3_NEOLC|nr:uncharacterized protein LOC124295050 [Neodiprion lecontei]
MARALLITPTRITHPVRLLIDPGPELTLISHQLTRTLNLHANNVHVPIIGVGSVPSGHTRGAVNFTLRSIHSNEAAELQAHVLPKLTIDILIGADSYGSILKPGVRSGTAEQPIAIHTIFGWAILGPINDPSHATHAHQGHLITNEHLHNLIFRFWELEQAPPSQAETLTSDEVTCEAHFLSTNSRDSQGRYSVRLPFKVDPTTLGNSKGIAQKSLERLLKRLANQPELCKLYKDFLAEYEGMGHMIEVEDHDPSPQGYYLPHHGVLRNGKIRVVFNGSCKTTSGHSLNDILHTGAKTQNDIFDVLLYVRKYRLLFITDIVKMFRQIRVHPEDRKFQRILWVEADDQLKTYELATVTYGETPALFLSGRAVQQLVFDEGERFPLTIEPLREGSYVDDISGGADDLHTLNAIATQVEGLCLKGCFPLSKWKSNHPDFIKTKSESPSSTESHEFHESTTKILGLAWQCAPDVLRFTGHTQPGAAITKRTILSETAQLFDPLGLICPVIVRAKILMQDLWSLKVGWDDKLMPQMIHRWTTFRAELSELSSLAIPRWLHTTSDTTMTELHGFSDASQSAMAAVVYIKVKHPHQAAEVTLVCSKTRVAPLQRLTMPRLELSAALLIVKLVTRVQEVLKLSEAPVTLWTDSAVSLAWINSDPVRWKEFVRNRVQEMHRTAPNATWKFIPGKQNPADCALRGVTPPQLITHKLWWSGPDWLARSPRQWPSFASTDANAATSELSPSAVHTASTTPNLPFARLLRYSSLTKVLRRTATVFQAVARLRRVPDSNLRTSPLTPADLQTALMFWIQAFQ